MNTNRLRKSRLETLEKRELLDGDGLDFAPQEIDHRTEVYDFSDHIDWENSLVNPSFFNSGAELIFTPTIVGGSATSTNPDSPSNAVDPNVGGTFGGVASISIQIPGFPRPGGGTRTQSFLCSGSVVASNYVLTAGHCFDGLDADGQLDPGTTATVNLNNGGDLSSTHVVSSITINDSFAGFSANLNDDIALLELSTPVPVGTPIYSLPPDAMGSAQRLNLVGYGLAGFGDTGFIANPSDPAFPSPEVKRQRQNEADLFVKNDEGPFFPLSNGDFVNIGENEIFILDFDGPSGGGILGGSTLGNDVEGTFGPGDSGGPAFQMTASGTLETDAKGRFIIGGINTFNGAFGQVGGPPGEFGGLSGGILLNPYRDWVNSIIGVDVQLSTSITVNEISPTLSQVTYELTATNAGANSASGIVIDQSALVLPGSASVTGSVASQGNFSSGSWDLGSLAVTDSQTLTISIDVDHSVLSPSDPFNIAFDLTSVDEPDTDPSNDSVSDSLDTPQALIEGSSWAVNAHELVFAENGTLPWVNLDTLSVNYAFAFPTAPTLEMLGPTDGSTITLTADGWTASTATYSFDDLENGFYKIITSGKEIDFSVLGGDATDSQDVDVFDFGAFSEFYQPGVFQGPTALRADFNGSGIVDVLDFGAFAENYLADLSAFTPPASPPPPAPATLEVSVVAADAVLATLLTDADDDDSDPVETQSQQPTNETGRRRRRIRTRFI